ncbi:MAG TPA: Zn-ribbon domain-containing OB-fold protein [Candidatus Thermoplasmatota archaeon]|nr:Zn-ribbon domain-containing OB-fold protein [Candidatus Thermoplasmatota archaeon]
MSIPRFWREIDQRYNLKGVKCGNCGHHFFPARTMCSACRHESIGKLAPVTFSGNGTVETCSVVHNGPAGFEDQTPYVMAIIKLDEGPRITAQIVDCAPDQVGIGTRVRKVFRRINEEGDAGVIHYGYKFAVQA